MLEAIDLEATRGDTVLFRGLSFALGPGTLLRVTGANGSGKTSLLRALCGLLMPSAGEVRWNGESIRAAREEYWKQLAYLGHANALKDDLTAEENLAVACALGGLAELPPRLRAALEAFGLAGHARLPVRAYSQGQRRRAALARLAVSAALPLWILDEPFASLDAAAVEQVQSLVAAHLARGGMTVITTHQEARIAAPSVLDIRLGG
ncbi:MAG TPA: cytochrome c biogenesis heme-transporting ATPase CcmA [Burkholderiales bacterium]|nr:cytochrome c biogenesis heme-transporting ATPase CcmA [Burkholderiales bacterium]